MISDNSSSKQEQYLKKLYSNRFNPTQRKAKVRLWKVLIDKFLQKHVGNKSDILDIGGGYCEFINNIQGKEKYLIDLNPDSKIYANHDVNVINIDLLCETEREKITKRFDIIFISNFFEHLSNKEELIEVLLFCFKSLNSGGSILIVQPNFKYSFKEYCQHLAL